MGDAHHLTEVKWEELPTDILVRITQFFNILELASSGIPQVCQAWRLAVCDPVLWKTLDLTFLKSNFIKIPREPFVYVHTESDKTVSRVLKIALSWSHGNTTTLLFNHQLFLRDEQLTYAAKRCPQLKRLVLPSWNRMKKRGLCNAIRKWPVLESLTMPSIENAANVMEEIALHCPNFYELKVMGTFDIRCASALVEYVPRLKALSLRCSIIFKNALMAILEGLHNLQVLNVSHCMIVESESLTYDLKRAAMLDRSTIEIGAGQPKLITCQERDCIMCGRMRDDEGLMRWYKYEEGLWKEDEVPSLAV